ncbi:small multi-drug export protein [Oscillibacter sp.]|uniref:COG2426 family protein n=1 Tax=Oscillibacter sp. TaxID=1945593 RepID=UPI00260B3C68|nr:small multi-drug export protein [Oscillibacter sp.]
MISYLKLLLTTIPGKLLSTFLLSMVPVIELRGGLPYGIALGLDYPLALAAAVLGNMVPVPFIVLYIRHIFAWLRKRSVWWNEKITKLEKRAHLKGRLVHKYSAIGLCVLVAIPLPGTGAWTGALVAALLDMRLKSAIPSIFLGVCIAAGIMTVVTTGIIHIL